MAADEAEEKRLRKLAKRAAKEVAAAAEAEEEAAEAKRQRKAAKKAAAAALEAPAEEVDDEEEAKRKRKAAKKAAKLAAAEAAAEPEADAPKKEKKEKKRAVEDDAEAEAPPQKKVKAIDSLTGAAAEQSLKCFIKGLPYSVDEATLRKDFEGCGEILQLQFPFNEEGKPKGFAFITYKTQEGFDAALKFENTEYSGRYISVVKADGSGGKGKDSKGKGEGKGGKGKAGDWTCPNAECGDNVFASRAACRQCGTARPEGAGGGGTTVGDNENTVFLRGLPWAITVESLRKDFAECGEIERLNMPMNEEGRPKGIAFIKFMTPEGVEACLKFDETDYGGRTVNVSKAEDRTGKGKDGKGKGKDGKGKDGKGKGKDGKKGKSKAPTQSFARGTGCILESTGEKKTFDDSDDE